MLVSTKSWLAKRLQSLPSPASRDAVIGLDFNHSQLFVVQLEPKRGRYAVQRFAACPFPADIKDLPQSLSDLFKRERIAAPKVSIGIAGSAVLTRFLQFPKMTLKELKDAMRYDIEKYIPFEANDVIVDFHILEGQSDDKKSMKVIMVAAKKMEVLSLIEALQQSKVKVHVIDIQALACFNAFRYAYPEAPAATIVLFDIGRDTSSLLVLVQGEPAFIREIALGSGEVASVFKRKIGWDDAGQKVFDLSDSVKTQADLFLQSAEPLVSQIRLSVNYCLSNNPKVEAPKTLYISGELTQIPEFLRYLTSNLGLETELWDCLREIDVVAKVPRSEIDSFRSMLPVAVGLALRMR